HSIIKICPPKPADTLVMPINFVRDIVLSLRQIIQEVIDIPKLRPGPTGSPAPSTLFVRSPGRPNQKSSRSSCSSDIAILISPGSSLLSGHVPLNKSISIQLQITLLGHKINRTYFVFRFSR